MATRKGHRATLTCSSFCRLSRRRARLRPSMPPLFIALRWRSRRRTQVCWTSVCMTSRLLRSLPRWLKPSADSLPTWPSNRFRPGRERSSTDTACWAASSAHWADSGSIAEPSGPASGVADVPGDCKAADPSKEPVELRADFGDSSSDAAVTPAPAAFDEVGRSEPLCLLSDRGLLSAEFRRPEVTRGSAKSLGLGSAFLAGRGTYLCAMYLCLESYSLISPLGSNSPLFWIFFMGLLNSLTCRHPRSRSGRQQSSPACRGGGRGWCLPE